MVQNTSLLVSSQIRFFSRPSGLDARIRGRLLSARNRRRIPRTQESSWRAGPAPSQRRRSITQGQDDPRSRAPGAEAPPGSETCAGWEIPAGLPLPGLALSSATRFVSAADTHLGCGGNSTTLTGEEAAALDRARRGGLGATCAVVAVSVSIAVLSGHPCFPDILKGFARAVL